MTVPKGNYKTKTLIPFNIYMDRDTYKKLYRIKETLGISLVKSIVYLIDTAYEQLVPENERSSRQDQPEPK